MLLTTYQAKRKQQKRKACYQYCLEVQQLQTAINAQNNFQNKLLHRHAKYEELVVKSGTRSFALNRKNSNLSLCLGTLADNDLENTRQ